MTDFTWPDGRRLAVSLVVNVEEGAEMSVLDGDKGPEPVDELGVALRGPFRNHGNESNYQYGIRRGAPRVLALLAAHGLPATFTCAALALERAPHLARAIIDGGHEVACHGWRWVHQFKLDAMAERALIVRAQQSITATTGTAPVGWLSRYLHTDNTRRLLAEAGFTYHMDDFSDDLPRWEITRDAEGGDPRPILVLPYALDSNDMKMWAHPSLTPRQWLDYAVDSFDWLRAEAASGATRMMSLGVHLRIIGRPGRIGAYDQFLRHIASRDDIWVATRRQIAAYYANQVGLPDRD